MQIICLDVTMKPVQSHQFMLALVLLSLSSIAASPLRSIFPKADGDALKNGIDPGEPLFLSPYIEKGDIKLARKLAKVGRLNGTDITSYSGFLTVNSTFNSNMFFWMFPANTAHPERKPLLLWLQGGPGGSSLFGLFVENGPFGVDEHLQLFPHKYAWTNAYNMLYFDNPVGTGFSFTDDERGYATNEAEVAENLYRAMVQIYALFPEFKQSPFYITGESYAGKYIPALAHRIHADPAAKFHLTGVAIGDGFTDPVTMLPAYSDYMLQTGLLDKKQAQYFSQQTDVIVDLIKNGQYVKAYREWDLLLNADSTTVPSFFTNCTGTTDYYNYLRTRSPPDFDYYNRYLALPQVRRALHVGNLTYHAGVKVEQHLMGDMLRSVRSWLAELMDNYRVLIYSGQLDIIVGFPLTEAMLEKLPWSGLNDYLKAPRQVWKAEPSGDVSGYVKVVKNFYLVLVRGGGHILPYDQPQRSYDMLHRFIYGGKF